MLVASKLRRPRLPRLPLPLPRPRLLPATIVAMSALLGVKSITLVQAIAGETDQSVPARGSDPAAEPRTPGRAVSAQAEAAPGSSTRPPTGMARDQAQNQLPAPSEAERGILLDLRRRRLALDARARDLDQREAEVAAADHRLADRIQQLASLQSRLETLEAGRQQHTAENWAGLVKVYEAMKARDAAAIFDVLDMQVLLQVLDRMQERRAAAILAAMQPDRARLATQMLAEMRLRAVTPAPDAHSKS